MKSTFSKVRVLGGVAALAMLLTVAACGGGGGGSGSSPSGTSGSSTPPASPPVSASSTVANSTVSTPQYASTSVESAMFTALNQARQSCGFPTLQENTLLDKAAASHALWMGANNTGGDSETAGTTDFTGTTYVARAAAAGFPSNVAGAGVSAMDYTVPASTNTQYGQNLVNEWLGGAYHGPSVLVPSGVIGIGTDQTPFNGYPQVWASMSLLNTTLTQTSSNGPLTYPCQGSTGVLYSIVGEQPAPPNTSGAFGSPQSVVGNPTDTIVLTSGTITDTSGHSINLQLLDSANDPNKILQPYLASAYPATPLAPSTTYTVSISGTDNGTAFSRNYSFTTAASE
jgi:uncharacterized protein YkwD